jgi:hypothetical protein
LHDNGYRSFKSRISDMTIYDNSNWKMLFPMIPLLMAVYCPFTVSMDTDVFSKLVDI